MTREPPFDYDIGMYRGPLTGVFTTYGIVDPRTGHFVYVGQTTDFERRKRAHLRGPEAGRRPPRIPRDNIVTWTFGALAAGVMPVIVVLETVGTYEESLVSESEWVHRLASENHPLLNRWKEHKEAMNMGRVSFPDRPRTLPPEIRRAMIARIPVMPRWKDEELRVRREKRAARGDKGLPWTQARDAAMVALYREGAGARQIASSIRRTPSSVRARLVRLGLLATRQDLVD
jgi:hypothetical protein